MTRRLAAFLAWSALLGAVVLALVAPWFDDGDLSTGQKLGLNAFTLFFVAVLFGIASAS